MGFTRVKQLLMGIGLLTVLGLLAMATLIAYLWWDTRNTTPEQVSTDVDTQAELGTEPEAEADD